MAQDDDREQRTEDATQRRREEARDRGQVAISTELVSAIGLAAGAGALAVGGAQLARATALGLQHTCEVLASTAATELDVPTSAALLRESVTAISGPLLAVVLPTIAVCAVTGYAQVGLRFSPKALEVDPGKLDPLRGFQRLFSMRGLVRTGLSFVKIVVIAGTAGTVAWMHVGRISRLGSSDLGPLLAAIGLVVLRTTAAALAAILALALLDLLFQRFQHERDLRMTRAEVKEEHRLTEGDPHVRARIRAVQRELATRRMMSDVPKATVVITNPTHYAVALRYERASEGRTSAPIVVAKGVDHLAERIKEVARASGVLCHEDVPLARTLYAKVAVGQEIPAELYAAVAAVLATVYRMQEAHA